MKKRLMKMFGKKKDASGKIENGKPIKRVVFVILGLLFLVGAAFFWKAGNVFNKISTKGGFLQNLVGALPGVNDELKGEKDGRINILALGMRGENIPGGGLLADTIIVVSVNPAENKIAMMSIPRDLYVDNPALGTKSKINAVYAYGEQKNKGQGLEDMKRVVGDITGLEIPYGGVINFKGFSELVNAIGGVEIELKEPFSEAVQFNMEHVCDSFFTIPTGKYENKTADVYFPGTKTVKRKRIVKSYPLCTAPIASLECGGNFTIPAGKQTLDGTKALCYVRSRATSSDFDRARRQQVVIQEIKNKALSMGTLTDFGKISDIMDSLGNNAQTNMQLWEMKRMFEIYSGMNNPQTINKVLENSEEGLLYNPPQEQYEGAGYILLPIGDNYDKIKEAVKNIFGNPATTQK